MEDLFFKVFKSKYILKTILKYCKYEWSEISKELCYGFDEINSVEWCIKNNHIELLFYKVKLGEYLTFQIKNTEAIYKTNTPCSYFNSLNFKQSSVSTNQEFYSNLYKNYYFTHSQKSIENTALLMCEFNLTVGLRVLIKDHYNNNNNNTNNSSIGSSSGGSVRRISKSLTDYSNSKKEFYEKLFYKSIYNGSIECCNYVLTELIGGIENIKIDKIKFWNKIMVPNLNVQLVNDRILFAIQVMSLKIPSKYKIVTNLFNVLLYKLTISTLLNCCFVIVLLKDEYKNYITSIKNKQYQDKKIIDTSITNEEPTEILTMVEFEKLKTKIINLYGSEKELNNIIISNVCTTDSSIQYLYKMLVPFTTHQFIGYNLSFYQIKYNNNYNGSNKQLKYPFSPLSFGDYSELIKTNTSTTTSATNSNKTSGIHINGLHGSNIKLFQYCKDDREKQKSFIRDSLLELKFNASNSTLPTKYLMELLLKNNDLEFIKIVYNELSTTQLNVLFPDNLFNFVNTSDIFDFIYSKVEQVFKYLDLNKTNESLKKHIKHNYPQLYRNQVEMILMNLSITSGTTSDQFTNQSLPFPILKYAIKNELTSNDQFKLYWSTLKSGGVEYKDLIWLVKRTPEGVPFSIKNKKLQLQVYHWILLNLKTKEFDITLSVDQLYLYHYINHSLDFYIKLTVSTYFFQYMALSLNQIVQRNDVQTLSTILSIYFFNSEQSVDSKHILYSFLYQCSVYGCTGIFQFIFDNYPHIFITLKESTASNFIKMFVPSIVSNFTNNNNNNNHINNTTLLSSNNNGTPNPLKLLRKSELDSIVIAAIQNGHIDLLLLFKKSIPNIVIPNSFYSSNPLNNQFLLNYFNK